MTTLTLSQRYAALQAERERSWSAEQLAANAAQRRQLVARHATTAHPQPGALIAPFTLIGADGRTITRDDLLAKGPAVLLFFRFGSCPADNIALPYYQETLSPPLRRAHIPLIAVSAQTPPDRTAVARHQFDFPVATDPDYTLARSLNLTFFPEDQPEVRPGDPWIGATLGTHSYEMVQPAIVVLNGDASLRHLAVSPDWIDRPETTDILGHLPEVHAAA